MSAVARGGKSRYPVLIAVMSIRVIEVSRRGSRVRVDTGRLVVECEGETTTLPICELEAVVLSERAVSISAAALAELAAANVAVTVCDARYRPAGMMQPLAATTVCDLFRRQIELREPVRKQLWQAIVRGKIANQAAVLRETIGDDAELMAFSRCVASGDAGNVEAVAAQRFWSVFPGVEKRDRDASDLNVLLNYGYMILWSMTARAICGTGMNPNVGLCHHNKYNPFCLASDLMEPFRFLAERAALAQRDFAGELTRERKRKLLTDILSGTFLFSNQKTTLSVALLRAASSLKKSILSGTVQLLLPEAA